MTQDIETLNVEKNTSSRCVFSGILRIVAIVCTFAGFFIGYEMAKEWTGYHYRFNDAVVWIWGIAGIASALWWYALSIIVDACQEYLKNK